MPRAKVVVDNKFREYGRELDRATERGLGRAAGVIVAAARGGKTSYDIDKILKSTKASSVKSTRKGAEVEVFMSHPLAHFFEKGTYQRKGALKKGGDPAGPSRGVKRGNFLKKAAREGFPGAIRAFNSAFN